MECDLQRRASAVRRPAIDQTPLIEANEISREFFENTFREQFIDFTMPRNRLGNSGDGIVIPVMLSAVANQYATGTLELFDELAPFHEILSSATCLTAGMLPLVSSS